MGKRGRPLKAKPWYEPFLAVLGANANVGMACRAAGLASRNSAYECRNNDPVFRAKWDEAVVMACDRLEQEAWQRAMAGSDTMMIFLLKAHRPDKFRETVRFEVLEQEAAAIAKRLGLPDPSAVILEAEYIVKEKNLD